MISEFGDLIKDIDVFEGQDVNGEVGVFVCFILHSADKAAVIPQLKQRLFHSKEVVESRVSWYVSIM